MSVNHSLLIPSEAAEFLRLKETTLSTWRSRRGRVARDGKPGPRFLRAGRKILYRQRDLEEFLEPPV
jgi:hypothetical protein